MLGWAAAAEEVVGRGLGGGSGLRNGRSSLEEEDMVVGSGGGGFDSGFKSSSWDSILESRLFDFGSKRETIGLPSMRSVKKKEDRH